MEEKEKEKKEKISRTRNYASILYPESAIENWREVLAEHHVPAFISPLHDCDENPNGEKKKEHFHIIIMFDSTKTKEQAEEIFDSIKSVGCERVKSIRGYSRYLCHLDNPDKAKYDTLEVQSLNGADYFGVIGLASDKYDAIGEMIEFCEIYDVTSFYALALYAKRNRQDWHRILCDCGAIYVKEFLKSKKWSKDVNNFQIINPETGEIL